MYFVLAHGTDYQQQTLPRAKTKLHLILTISRVCEQLYHKLYKIIEFLNCVSRSRLSGSLRVYLLNFYSVLESI